MNVYCYHKNRLTSNKKNITNPLNFIAMETKKLKKLSFKKETIANLSNFEQSRIVGGYDGEEASKGNYIICELRSHLLTDCPANPKCPGNLITMDKWDWDCDDSTVKPSFCGCTK